MMNSARYDFIVVGAGPAGSTVARKLAVQGYSTLLLDKAEFPRYKVCGGGVTQRAYQELDIDIQPIIRDSIDSVELCVGGDLRHTFKKNLPFIHMVMRDEFDKLLLDAALSVGVVFRPGTRVKNVAVDDHGVFVETMTESYQASYLIGADGVNSTVASSLGLMQSKRKILALEYEMMVDQATMQRYQGKVAIDYGYIGDGYAWVFPKRDHLSVGIGLGTSDGRLLQNKLMEYLAREQITGHFVSEKGHFLSVGGTDDTVVKGRVALIGDAGGLVDPLMYEGIFYALRSANMLAEEFPNGVMLNPASPFEGYQKRIAAEILSEMRLFARASKAFYSAPNRFHRLFLAQPRIIGQALRVVAGESSFVDYYHQYRRNFVVKAIARFTSKQLLV